MLWSPRYPWGEEAFEKSRKENKPIFLSVGYSTCHWCHVMERESFENEDIAKILSEHFVSIKVDREERPDVDKVYMTFIQASQGGGGWPMSVFLTPELEPFLGGTYFPPEDHFNRPGFPTILRSIAKQWEKDEQGIRQKSAKVMAALQQMVEVASDEGEGPPGLNCVQKAYQALKAREDKQYGGFGSAPKFPQPVILGFLLKFYARYIGSEMGQSALDMVLVCLRAMNNGGIHDHIGQGFHRYSTDELWHVPHFEKMLYDQAQLACVYLDAYQITHEEIFASVARDILLYVSRDLTDEEGGFYAAEDADSFPLASSEQKKEGAFCVWTEGEISSLLSSPLPSSSLTVADLFCHHYGVKSGGNVPSHKDPHGELSGQNVLIVRGSVEETANHFQLSVPVTVELLSKARDQLAQARRDRPKPLRDNKLVTSWNGLAISAFARGYQVLDEQDYLERALKALILYETSSTFRCLVGSVEVPTERALVC
ncbi:Spermatogenesis-associated protein 20 [Geodia barretti]|uniref:Spermatogenesis-associated protein 20 n=3 Tax=Geodia barretti TaxID=519541 RepID=A0AA35WWL3_GEOBA|nr:Spermatogenesis-associated protein 20 [Geodia barretti]